MKYKDMLKKAKKELPEVAEKEKRFKIPYVDIKKEGKKTIIKNFSKLTKHINREKDHLAKYLYSSSGASGYVSGRRLILNSDIKKSRLIQLVKDYVNDYVLCEECGKADTNLTKEGKITKIKCTACGAVKTLKGV